MMDAVQFAWNCHGKRSCHFVVYSLVLLACTTTILSHLSQRRTTVSVRICRT
jgi:hypothetical protein